MEFYHPDLVYAADAVVGKLGYSTIAEIYYAQVPFGYVTRPGIREPELLESFVHTMMKSMPISIDEYFAGEWLHNLHYLISSRTCTYRNKNGAIDAAEIIFRVGNGEFARYD